MKAIGLTIKPLKANTNNGLHQYVLVVAIYSTDAMEISSLSQDINIKLLRLNL